MKQKRVENQLQKQGWQMEPKTQARPGFVFVLNQGGFRGVEAWANTAFRWADAKEGAAPGANPLRLCASVKHQASQQPQLSHDPITGTSSTLVKLSQPMNSSC